MIASYIQQDLPSIITFSHVFWSVGEGGGGPVFNMFG